MLTINFFISLIRIATFVIFAILIEKLFYNRKLDKSQKLIFKSNCRNNVNAYIIIGFSIITLFNISESSYIFYINKYIANYGPWLILLIGIMLCIKNYKFNNKLKKIILEDK